MAHFLFVTVWLLIVLGVMVFFHELGHFIVAKLCGVRIETFSLGFGKRLFGFRRGDTDYRVSLLPLGGYVKMAGEYTGETTETGDFTVHPRWQRILIAIAGPTANFLLALVIMTVVFMNHHEIDDYLSGAAVNDYTIANSPAARTGIQPGDPIVRFDDTDHPDWEAITNHSLLNMNRAVPFAFTHDGRRTDTTLQIAATEADARNGDIISLLHHIGMVPRVQNLPIKVVDVEPNMPAHAAGLRVADQVTGIDGLQTHSVQTLIAYMQDQAGKPATLSILREGAPLTLAVTPQSIPSPDGTRGYRLGFAPLPPPVHVDHLPASRAVAESWHANLKSATMIKDVLKGMFERHVSPRQLAGPIGIGQQVGLAARDSVWTLMRLMAMISINLGIFNLLPFPILDGGMILFLLIESVLRRDLNQKFKERVYQVAFVCIVLFAAMVIFNDLSKLSLFSKLKS